MRVSFIVTPDAQGLSHGCVDSLLATAIAGDEVIIVAARGSPLSALDGVAGRSRVAWLGPEARKRRTQAGAVVWRLMRLAARPWPGRAVAANSGLSLATGEAVVFVSGGARLDPSGMAGARSLLTRTAADVVIARFEGPHAGDEAETWQHPVRNSALRMEAQPGRMLLRRDFLKSSGLRLGERASEPVTLAFHWHACLRAREIAFHDRVMLHASEAARSRAPEARAAVFGFFAGLQETVTPGDASMALRDALARQVGRDLAALPPDDYWRYFDALDSALPSGEWPDGRGGRALATLAARPKWQAVAQLQGEAIWRSLDAMPGQDAPPEDPGRQATNRAIALWRALRTGSGGSIRA